MLFTTALASIPQLKNKSNKYVTLNAFFFKIKQALIPIPKIKIEAILMGKNAFLLSKYIDIRLPSLAPKLRLK